MKERAPRNRTLTCSESELAALSLSLLHLSEPAMPSSLENAVVHQDLFDAIKYLPQDFVDLLILDPPYNLSKNFNGHLFKAKEKHEYTEWFAFLISILKPTLKSNSTIYVCADWKTSVLIAPVLEEHFCVRNRITWEREKGRGAKANWKNNTEDIWFCTVGEDFVFDVEAVKLKRKVIAPYRDAEGKPKDWDEGEDGNFRLTHPSNIWTDITIPFWSMPENTDHPTQKPEKLIAKLVLASSKEGALVFDPFLGSGTTAVVCKKLNRRYLGIEQNLEYCCWAQKRIERATDDSTIQGYADGVFWERNSLIDQKAEKVPVRVPEPMLTLFNE
jgi:site-specific DNA-methyltransferase (adenine-specific)